MDRSDFTVTTKEGYSAILQPYKNKWKSIVHDKTFPGFTRTFSADVKLAPGYKLEQVVKKDISWQQRNIQLFSNNNKPIVYIGKLGLSGGGPLNFFGYNFCVMIGCFNVVYNCECGYKCPYSYCSHHCVHKKEHQCSKRCPHNYKIKPLACFGVNNNLNISIFGQFDTALQFNEMQRKRFKNVNGIQNALIDTIHNNQEKANQAYQSRDELAEIAADYGDWIIIGRKILQFESDSSTMNEAEVGEYQNHHIVHKKLKEHPAFKKSGIHIDNEANLVTLPTKKGIEVLKTNRSRHQGRHTDFSKEKLEQKLDEIDIQGIAEGWDQKKYEDAVYKLMKDERRNLRSGSTDLYEQPKK